MFLAVKKRSQSVDGDTTPTFPHQVNGGNISAVEMASVLLSNSVDGNSSSLPQYVTLDATSEKLYYSFLFVCCSIEM